MQPTLVAFVRLLARQAVREMFEVARSEALVTVTTDPSSVIRNISTQANLDSDPRG